MAVFPTFSKRQARQPLEASSDWCRYLPPAFRNQVLHLWKASIGRSSNRTSRTDDACVWSWIHDTVACELGLPCLTSASSTPLEQCRIFLLREEPLQVLDLIEVSLVALDRIVRGWDFEQRGRAGVTLSVDEAISEFNERCWEHKLECQYMKGMLVRSESPYLHQEVVEPALSLLVDHDFAGPIDEFRRAQEHLRAGRFKESIVEAGKAFESTMKAMMDRRGAAYEPGAPASKLIHQLFEHNVLPPLLKTQFNHLENLLESGAPTVRNRRAAHGQGIDIVAVDPHLATYALHLVAANIVLLSRASISKP